MLILPYRIEDGYDLLLQGSTYALMPSIYEPFGAAVEFLANGTPVIARDTGGLHDQLSDGCGILYKEDADYRKMETIEQYAESPFTLDARGHNVWAQAMSTALAHTLKTAADKLKNNKTAYYELIQKGLQRFDTFSWKNTVDGYWSVIQG